MSRFSGFNAARSIICGATFYMTHTELYSMFQCRTQHYMWCNNDSGRRRDSYQFQCRTQHFMWCNNEGLTVIKFLNEFQCRTQHFMWCNREVPPYMLPTLFQCRTQHFMWCNASLRKRRLLACGFNAARSILCGATMGCKARRENSLQFQCRTQHFMWCNSELVDNTIRNGVSMPHAAFYVVQQRTSPLAHLYKQFQCRTQHFMWCNKIDRREHHAPS